MRRQNASEYICIIFDINIRKNIYIIYAARSAMQLATHIHTRTAPPAIIFWPIKCRRPELVDTSRYEFQWLGEIWPIVANRFQESSFNIYPPTTSIPSRLTANRPHPNGWCEYPLGARANIYMLYMLYQPRRASPIRIYIERFTSAINIRYIIYIAIDCNRPICANNCAWDE